MERKDDKADEVGTNRILIGSNVKDSTDKTMKNIYVNREESCKTSKIKNLTNSEIKKKYIKEKDNNIDLKIKIRALNDKLSKYEKQKNLLINNYEDIILKMETLKELQGAVSKIEAKKELMEDQISHLKENVSLVKEGRSDTISINYSKMREDTASMFR